MKKPIKGLQECRHQLRECEQVIFSSIIHQLARIGRYVDAEELDFIPFGEEVSPYIEGFSLRQYAGQNIPEVKTSFADIDDKELIEFLSDGEVSHDDLINLLEMLSQIRSKTGEEGSFLVPVEDKYISFEAHDRDCWICTCGNYAEAEGFYPCDRDGNVIEPVTDSWWDELYRCERCGRVIDQRDHRVLGRNENPEREEEEAE